ncbi:Putative disease resistance RPP13-like protein [Arachis hypogaea]|uniref:Disease resistance RPP13-like protein n=2 Tax=Arachis hypogaea TaxID=3818 RepID=A0A6B9V3L2_ARAHY|nr:putative disease resistance RPP13-like protein 1 isoform X2 [Arachis hypogaea]QHN76013.1 Putative disease resistance RPP13-like protein [Arachis hypogaea]
MLVEWLEGLLPSDQRRLMYTHWLMNQKTMKGLKLSAILEDDDFVLEGNDSALELLQKIEKSLYDVGPVLDDAELKQFSDKKVKKWLIDLQDALYKADDLLDELSTKAATATQRDPGNSSPWSHYVDSCIEDSGINVIGKTVATLESVKRRKGYLRLFPKESAKMDISSWRIPSTSLVVSSDIFGRDQDKERIIKLLLDDTCDAESPVTVIPIVGMGGIGKTTLAQLVYNDAKVVEKFGTRAWVCVAENPDPVNVTRTIIGAMDSSSCNVDHFDSLQTALKEKLTGKTFLVVLDDVWHDRRDMWEDFLKPFHYGNTGSKILLTTRSEKVASVFAANNLHYRLSLLSDEDCWSVFLKHSSISTNSSQYATLEPIGRKIVEKCKGLPLAVKTLGGLLRNKHIEGDWKNILKSEIWELSEDDSKIVPALRVSYHYLPSHLKRCFVYCSIFPEDYEFDKDELILLWMAEDLLQPKENNALENVGCAYFDELVARSFFQPSNTNEKLFVMHDLMHDLATFFAGKFYFKVKEFGHQHMIDNKTRHLSYAATEDEDSIKLFQEANNRAVHMRTFLYFSFLHHPKSIDIESDPCLLRQQLGCLRVLSFERLLLASLLDSIGELIHLRYLNLSDTPIVTLPESICKLYNLQTLKLKNCAQLEMLPSSMQDLVNLRHLDIRGASHLKAMPKEISKLKHINFLSDYIVGEHEGNGIRELGTLDNLHGSFCISKLENVKNSGEVLEAKMGKKKHINTLELNWLPDGDIDDLQTERDILDKLQPHENLKELSIVGYRGERFPDWLGLSCYSNMTKLSLDRCMNCCKLPSLGQLPSLQHLEFSDLDGLEKIDLEFYNKNNASFQQETPFKCLETLKIVNMSAWREWHFPQEFNGFPKLRVLSLKSCPVLSGDLPAHLPALEELNIVECEELACPLPRAPKLHQLLVEGSSMSFGGVEPHNIEISGTQLANSVLECLPHIQPPRVRCLRISNCESAISISADYLPASLLFLQIYHCSKLTFPEQVQHKSLTEIEVVGCGSLTLFPMGGFPNLEKLKFYICESMEYVVVSEALQSLRYFELSHCPSLVSLPTLGMAVPHLEELHLYDCPEIDCFADEGLPPSLKKLQLTECHKLASWIASKGLQSEGLTHLELCRCSDVKSFPGEGCLPASLEFLELWKLPNLETLDCKGLHHLTSLKNLRIRYCDYLNNIREEHLLASIENIFIGNECPLTRKLKEMEDLRIEFARYYMDSDYSDDDYWYD